MRKHTIAMLVIALAGALQVPPAAAQRDVRCFPETGYCVGGRVWQYWSRAGGLDVFGYPVGEQRREVGIEGVFDVQWFERERFELHPANRAPYDVLLGRLGDELLRRQGRDWRMFPKGQPKAGCQYFEITAHTLCEPFLGYWRTHGLEFDGRPGKSYDESLALFGLPLSEPAIETNSSGFTVLTQWFERARFEYVPENPDPYKVLLGRLGAEVYDPTAGTRELPYRRVDWPTWPYPLEVPAGFTIEEAADALTNPRFMTLDPTDGSVVYAAPAAGAVVRLRDNDGDGRYDQQQTIASGLPFVHSVAFVDGWIYAAAEDRLVRIVTHLDGRAPTIEQVLALPSGSHDLYGHRTRTIAQGPDGRLYLSIGSSCDVCIEDTPQRATILRFNRDGSGVEVFASGLRNTVGFDWRPFTDEMWGADMGRNNLGPDLPPDEFNRIELGKDYGWPYCYGDRVPNPEFNDAARCAGTVVPAFEFPAHWSPLGVAFYDQVGFPPSYQGDAIVAFHGTASDQVPTLSGYKVVRVRFKNRLPVALEDLVRGWEVGGIVWGRPAGLLVMPDGSLLISDDLGGRIYRLRYVGR